MKWTTPFGASVAAIVLSFNLSSSGQESLEQGMGQTSQLPNDSHYHWLQTENPIAVYDGVEKMKHGFGLLFLGTGLGYVSYREAKKELDEMRL